MPVITKKTFLPSSLNNQLPAYISYFVSGMLIVENWEQVFKKLNILEDITLEMSNADINIVVKIFCNGLIFLLSIPNSRFKKFIIGYSLFFNVG